MRRGHRAREDFGRWAAGALEKLIQIMQTNEITEATPLDQFVFYAVPIISPALSYLICLGGIFVCVWAFRKSRKMGYLIIGAYFLYPFVGFLLGLVGHMFAHPPVPPDQTFVHDEADRKSTRLNSSHLVIS